MRVERLPVVGPLAVRAGLAALPVVSLGLLCPVPSLVIALRRGGRADWGAFGVFCAVLVAWVLELALTPETTHGIAFADDTLLILVSMAGASVHAWTVWPRRMGRRGYR
ncbi:hypothetical protein [Streptomyces jeddahensis]|uniref:Uncharacterized protein n=1 Tax=Streptomyces jeddahensis TaxID=1716141 RepID=A0A177HTF3_9ACTN|nr:hypothetical protein [Streptomyces jeddahensis]OAH14155.1 hypothetical protein STSP_26050 [Streptomyces jeddahensis]